MNKDLTVGNPSKVLFRFCMPLFGSILFQQLYNVADSFVAGKFINENSLAAVGNSFEITLIFIAIAFGCNVGCSVVVSNLFGAGKLSDLKTVVYTTFISVGALCALLMVLGRALSGTLLGLINTPSEIMQISEIYLNIYIYGLPFVFFYNVCTGIFSALGDSKTPFIFLMCSSVSNIGLDILFVKAFSKVFTYGIDAVAWATFLCQGVSCILAFVFVMKRLKGIKTEKPSVFSFSALKSIAKIAVPSMLQQSFISFGNIMIQGIINPFGTGFIAGYAAAVKLNNLAVTSFTAFGTGMSNYTAQNIGAEKFGRIKEGFRASVSLTWFLSIPLSVIYFFFSRRLIILFLDSPSITAVNTGAAFLKIVSPFYTVISLKLIADGLLRGASRMKQFMVATFTDLVLRVILVKASAVLWQDSVIVWAAWPIGWIIAAIISVWYYKRYLRESKIGVK